jgi:PAS domain S-box-containing protein
MLDLGLRAPPTAELSNLASRERVWIVDDSRLESEHLRRLLAPHYEVEVFSEGATALEQLQQRLVPDVIVLDWEMPGLSGPEVCRFLRERWDGLALPILMLTSHARHEDISAGLDAGANDFVSKPFNETELLARMRTLMLIGRVARERSEHLRAAEHSQAWLTAVLGSIGDGVIATDTEGRMTFLNPVAQEITGWSEADAVGQPIEVAFTIVDDQERAVKSPVRSALAEGKTAKLAGRTVLLRKNGSELMIDDSASPIRDVAGVIRGAVLVFRDVTEKDLLERERAQRTRELELASAVGRTLASTLPLRTQLQRCVEFMVTQVDAAFVRIWTVDAGGDTLVLQASAGMYTHLDGDEARVALGTQLIGRIAAQKLAHVSNDLAHDPELRDPQWAASEGLRAFAGFPILVGDHVIGVLALYSRQAISAETTSSLSSLADELALGIERSNLDAERERLFSETEKARLESDAHRAQLAALFAEAPVAMAILRGPEHVIDLVNPSAALMWGRPAHEVLGQKLLSVLPEAAERGMAALLDGVLASGRPFVGSEVPVKLGAIDDPAALDAYVDFVYQPMRDAAGSIHSVLCIGTDVTDSVLARRSVEELAAALREREERLRLAIEAGNAGTWELNLATHVLDSDVLVKRLFGLGGDDELTLAVALGRMIDGDGARVAAAIAAALRGVDEGRFNEQYRVVNGAGQTRWVDSRGHALFDPRGQPTRFLGTLVDITDRKNAESLRDALLEASERQRDFEQYLVGIVSHDLRSPMQAIIMGSQVLLGRDSLDERTTKTLVRIKNSADRATRLIRDVLDFTQARLGGGFKLQKRPMNLHELAREAIEEIQLNHPERELRLRLRGDPEGNWDQDRLSQILPNLVTNALKYSTAETPVTVSVHDDPDDAAAIELAVHNFGAAIDPQLLPTLFLPMRRAVPGSDSRERSVGLGLYIVDHIAQAHGGRILVSSTAAEGTTFRVRLPRLAPAGPAAPIVDPPR